MTTTTPDVAAPPRTPAATAKADAAAKAAAALAAKMARRRRRTTMWRGRRMIRPILLLCAVQLVGILQWQLPASPLWAGGFCAVAGIVAIAKARGRSGDAALMWRTLLGMGWLLAASILGPFGLQAAALWVVGVLLAVPYWQRHKTPFVPGSSRLTDAENAATNASMSPEQRVWAARVAQPAANGVPAGALLGSSLSSPAPIPGGWSARVQGLPGVHDLDKIHAAARKIASAYEISRAQVMVEMTEDGAENCAQITVITRSDNLERVHILEDDGASIDEKTGLARCGYFADLKPAHLQFFTDTGGAQMFLFAGGTGSGKSRAVEAKIALEHRSRVVVPILLDAQDGSSMPDWNGRTWKTALGIEDAFAELQCLDWVMRGRAHMIARLPWVDEHGRERIGHTFLMPHPGMPMFGVSLDEAPLLLQDETYGPRAVKLLSAGGKTWRKAGGSIALITQVPSLEELKSQTLRAMLRGGGTVISFRTGESVSQQMLGMANDPSKLPEFFPGSGKKTHGLGYIVGVDRRQATFRNLLTRDPYGIAASPPGYQVDEGTLRLFDRYTEQLRRRKVTRDVPAPAETTAAAAPAPTSGDVIAALEQVLAGAAGPLDMGSIVAQAGQRVRGCSIATVKSALRSLEADDRVYRQGDRWAPVPAT